MKIYILSFVLTLTVFYSHAQVDKSSLLAGGNVWGGISSGRSTGMQIKGHNITIKPSLGFVYKKNRVLGLSLGYHTGKTRTSYDFGSEYIQKSKDYNGGFYFRSYYPVAKDFAIFGQADVFGDYMKRNNNSSDTLNALYAEKSISAGFYLTPGVSYRLNKRFMIEASFAGLLGVSYGSFERKSIGSSLGPGYKHEGFSFDSNSMPASGINLGFRIVLGSK